MNKKSMILSFLSLSILLFNSIASVYALDIDSFWRDLYLKEGDKISKHIELINANKDWTISSVISAMESSQSQSSWTQTDWSTTPAETIDTSGTWTDVWSGQYIEFWYDKYYQTMKEQEADTKIQVQTQLNNYRNKQIPITDDKVVKLNNIMNRTFGSDYYILGIKFNNVSYFKFGSQYIVFYPYKISWNTDLFEKEIKSSVNSIVSSSKPDADKATALQDLLAKYKISFFTVNELEENKIKLVMGEQRNVKIELDVPFITDKYYLPEMFKNDDTGFLIYTVIDKAYLEQNNILWTNTVTDKIQPFIYLKDSNVYYSLDYLNWDGYIQKDNGKIKILSIDTKKKYVVQETMGTYIIIGIFAFIFFILWIVLAWVHYNKKFKKIFQKTSESS